MSAASLRFEPGRGQLLDRNLCTRQDCAVGRRRQLELSIAASSSQPALPSASKNSTALIHLSSASQKSRADSTSSWKVFSNNLGAPTCSLMTSSALECSITTHFNDNQNQLVNETEHKSNNKNQSSNKSKNKKNYNNRYSNQLEWYQ